MEDEINFYFDMLAVDFCEGIDEDGQFIVSKKGKFGIEYTESSTSHTS